uniref:Ig-like domain-containing protein n=1 Tax=Rhinolophus ferrumequinum TaxID=59479 RepID=A0A671DQ93_RHIFE
MKRLLGTVLALLCTPICCVRGVQVEQSPTALSLQEGASSTLRCKFSTSLSNVQWFRQNPGGGLINLFYIPSGTKVNGRLTAKTDPKERNSSLHISSSQTTDSAIYFCAGSHSVPQAPAACTQTLSWAQLLLQPQSHHKIITQPLHSLILPTHIGRVLTTDTFGPYTLETLVFIFPSQSTPLPAL